MKHKRTAAVLLSLLLVLSLCACTGGETVPEATKAPAPPAPTTAARPPEESPEGSWMRRMELTAQEKFYLDAFSLNDGHNLVYEVKLLDEYSEVSMQIYRYKDGAWERYRSGGKIEIDRDTLYFAVSTELTNPNMAFKCGNRGSALYGDADESAFGGYCGDYDFVDFLPISPVEGNSLVAYVNEDEMPLIAYRRMPVGESRPASVEDFHAPENVEAGEIEEYYMLTVQFIYD